MRLLFSGDMGPSGFGSVTHDLGLALLDAGVDVRFLSRADVPESLAEPFRSRTLEATTFVTDSDSIAIGENRALPELLAGHSTSKLANGELYGDWKPDAVLLLGDFGAVRLAWGPYADVLRTLPTFHYCPVEGVDLPPSWKIVWDDIHPIAMSKFGQREIAKVTGAIPPLMYHGVDTEAFHPVSPEQPIAIDGDERSVVLKSKAACRQFFTQGPVDMGRVWVLRTDSHWPRKNQNLLIRSMVPVLERHPNVDLILHASGGIGPGGNLFDTLSKVPEPIRDRIVVTHLRGIPRPVLTALYNASDIYVSPSAEGFGLTIAEALSCGLPAVGLDYSSVPEVIGPAGQLVPVARLWDNPYDHFWADPDETAFGDAVEFLVTHPARRREMGALGPGHVRKSFSWAEAARIFLDVMSPKAMEVAA